MRCLSCNCSNEKPCPSGCSWTSVYPPLCSNCVGPMIGKCKAAPIPKTPHLIFKSDGRPGMYCARCRNPVSVGPPMMAEAAE